MSTRYYQKKKEILQKEARDRYLNLSEEEKKQKQARERYQNSSGEEKEKKCQHYRIIVNVIKIFLNIKNKNQSSIEEIII